MKTKSEISAERVKGEVRSRISALHGLTAERLRQAIDAFHAGMPAAAARIWEAAEARDDMLLTVAEKRKSEAAALDWTIGQTDDDDPEAKAHREVLEDFYNNVRVTSAVDEDQRGELSLLFRQMMDARAKKYAVHEVIWDPRGNGVMRAEFRFAPLWFFERRTGKLRFIETEGGLEGVEMREKEWLVMACPRALMEPCSKAYLIKTLALGDMVLYSQKVGVGGVTVSTPARFGTPEWELAREVADAVGGDWRVVKNNDMTVEHVDLTSKGQLPMPLLIESMDRAMAALWRGGDLSTISSGPDSTGASLQGDEIDALLADDARMISGTLNATVDRWVLEARFGRGVEPKAWFRLNPPQSVDIGQDRENMKAAYEIGLPISKAWVQDHFGLPAATGEDDELRKPADAGMGGFGGGFFGAGNEGKRRQESGDRSQEAFVRAALAAEAKASAEDFRAVFTRLAQIQAMENEGEQRAALERLRASLPQILKELAAAGRLAKAREATMGAAMGDGLVERRRKGAGVLR